MNASKVRETRERDSDERVFWKAGNRLTVSNSMLKTWSKLRS